MGGWVGPDHQGGALRDNSHSGSMVPRRCPGFEARHRKGNLLRRKGQVENAPTRLQLPAHPRSFSGGDQTRAEVLLTETEPLCKLPGMPAPIVLMHHYMRGLLLMNKGALQESIAVYKGIVESPAFAHVPPLYGIMVNGSMLMAVSMFGDEQASAELSQAYAELCIPEQNCVGSSQFHYCMAVFSLVQGLPYKAWLHANKSREVGQTQRVPVGREHPSARHRPVLGGHGQQGRGDGTSSRMDPAGGVRGSSIFWR
jgi:hypothetical protein